MLAFFNIEATICFIRTECHQHHSVIFFAKKGEITVFPTSTQFPPQMSIRSFICWLTVFQVVSSNKRRIFLYLPHFGENKICHDARFRGDKVEYGCESQLKIINVKEMKSAVCRGSWQNRDCVGRDCDIGGNT